MKRKRKGKTKREGKRKRRKETAASIMRERRGRKSQETHQQGCKKPNPEGGRENTRVRQLPETGTINNPSFLFAVLHHHHHHHRFNTTTMTIFSSPPRLLRWRVKR
jgi:hypothetical protein